MKNRLCSTSLGFVTFITALSGHPKLRISHALLLIGHTTPPLGPTTLQNIQHPSLSLSENHSCSTSLGSVTLTCTTALSGHPKLRISHALLLIAHTTPPLRPTIPFFRTHMYCTTIFTRAIFQFWSVTFTTVHGPVAPNWSYDTSY